LLLLCEWKLSAEIGLYQINCTQQLEDCLLSIAVACVTARLSTCLLAWSAVLVQVRIWARARNYVKWIHARML